MLRRKLDLKSATECCFEKYLRSELSTASVIKEQSVRRH